MRTSNHPKTLILTVIVLGLILFGQANALVLKPKTNIDQPLIHPDRSQKVNLIVQFDIPQIDIDFSEHRSDLNLALVIDRSGSMEDRGKMEYAKKAAKLVVDKMTHRDRLAIVDYDDYISVLWPSSPVENKRRIKSRISELHPRGSTNLTGGMMKGVDEALRGFSRGGINRVLLLSDGLANTGITDTRKIKSLVRDARRKGITISTMGLGLDYNEDLMQTIAEHAGGNYYFIEHPNQMHAIFERELGNMYATVARDVKARLRTTRAVKDIQVYGYLFEEDNSDIVIDLGDLYAGEKMSMVVQMEVDPDDEGTISLGTIEFEYIDTEDNQRKTYQSKVKVETTRDVAQAEKAVNRDAAVEAALVVADDFQEKQTRLYEQGDMAGALANISDYADQLTSQNATLNDVKIEKKIEALAMEAELMEEADRDAPTKSSYFKKSKARSYNAQKGKRGMYLLQEGDSGYEVERLQQTMTDKKLYSGPIDGKYNSDLLEAVKKFQKDNNIDVDGVAGPKTLKELGLY